MLLNTCFASPDPDLPARDLSMTQRGRLIVQRSGIIIVKIRFVSMAPLEKEVEWKD